MRAHALSVMIVCGGSACYQSHSPGSEELGCEDPAPRCVRQPEPCAARVLVEAQCDGQTWSCPAGSAAWTPVWTETRCIPRPPMGEAPLPVPIDGVCSWVYPSADDGRVTLATTVPTSCASLAAPFPLTVAAGAYDYLASQSSFFDASGRVRLQARTWTLDGQQLFGVRSDGVGFALLQDHSVSLATPLLFDEQLDLGDAAVVDAGFLYAYGCPGAPHWLEEDCIVGRAPLAELDRREAWRIWGEQGWGQGAPKRVFGSGPHRGPVVHDPKGGFLHVYAIGFGSTVQLTHADRPEGPWASDVKLIDCELPSLDEHAYCAGVVVYLELHDPSRPDELMIGYSIGTTAEDGATLRAAHPLDYAPRIVRVRRP